MKLIDKPLCNEIKLRKKYNEKHNRQMDGEKLRFRKKNVHESVIHIIFLIAGRGGTQNITLMVEKNRASHTLGYAA